MIDWARITELRDEVGAEDFEEVVDLFMEEVETAIAGLRALETHDNLAADLHFLKGGALSLGFTNFSSACQDGERMSTEGRAGEVDLDEIIASFDQSRVVFTSGLSAHLAA